MPLSRWPVHPPSMYLQLPALKLLLCSASQHLAVLRSLQRSECP